MPELPEVEIVRQSLLKNIKGKKINKVLVRNRNLRLKLETAFEKKLKNKFISNVKRFSKYLIIELGNKSFCIVHLGMSGTIHIIKNKKHNLPTNTSFYNAPNLPKNHNHVEFFFKDMRLIYNDPRRFGYFQIFNDFNSMKKKFKKFGPEPFDKKFNSKYFINYFKKKEKSIKNFLLDQNFVSGIGNIYASEILYKAKIHPFRSTNSLSDIDLKTIIKACRFILKKAIKLGGTTIKNHAQPDGKLGYFKQKLKVYGRTGEKCFSCKNNIINSSIAKRSTYYCDNCQM